MAQEIDGALIRDLPGWGPRYGTRRAFGDGPQLSAMRAVLPDLSAREFEALSARWLSVVDGRRREVVDGWRLMFANWNTDMNRSPNFAGWDEEAYEPVVRIVDAIALVIDRASALGLILPSRRTVETFAAALHELTALDRDRLDSLDLRTGPPAWRAALFAAAAVSAADVSPRSPALDECLAAMLAMRPAASADSRGTD